MDSVIIEKIDELVMKKTDQNFKTHVPIQLLWDFLKTNFDETDTHFQVTAYLFHKTEYNKNLLTFISTLKPYYHNSKRKYIERPINYKWFLTIIRQLCNAHNIKYNTKLVYNKSTYEIEYSIYK
jgi:hypothetical protein